MGELEGPQTTVPLKISASDTRHFDREGFSGNHYVEANSGRPFSALTVDVHGRHPRQRMVGATRTYLVLEGTGTFTVNGTASEIKPGDMFIIPDGGEYEYQGTMRLFEFNVPSTTSTNVVNLDPE